MYAIIRTGGKQYRVAPDDVLEVEKLKVPQGETFEIEDVLAVNDNDNLIIGTPVVEDAVVKAEVLEHGKDPKVIVFKYKPKKDYRKKQGHRQPFTRIKITGIELAGTELEKDVVTATEPEEAVESASITIDEAPETSAE